MEIKPGEIHVDVDGTSAVLPFTYNLYDVDTNLIQTTNDTFFTALISGNYVIQVQDAIGCLNPFELVFIDQPDTIFACGVDMINDTAFDVFTHTVIANDPTTWNFQTGVLAPNFKYYLAVIVLLGCTLFSQVPLLIKMPLLMIMMVLSISFQMGLLFQDLGGLLMGMFPPDIDIYTADHIYIYNSPSDVNGLGPQNDYFTGSGNILNFEFFGLNSASGDTIANQGGLRFRLHKGSMSQQIQLLLVKVKV